MSAAGQAAAAPQTARASELTEGIGDVLASIRRMIAQEAGATPRPALAAVGETGERGGVLRLGPERRCEAGPAAAPEEDRTAPARAMALRWANGAGAYTTAPAAVVPTAPPRAVATPGEAEMSGGLAEATMPAAQTGVPRESQATAALLEPLPADSPAPWAAEGDLAAHTAPLRLAPVPEAAPLAPPPVEAAPLVAAGPALGAIVTTPAGAAVPPVATPAAPPAAPAAPQPPAAPAAAGGGEDADFLGSMIRDVLRQELRGDGSGRMGQELRSMILREVARVITGPDA